MLVVSFLAAAFLAGCAGNNVVAEAVALKPVPRKLMRTPQVPKCELRDQQRDDIDVGEIEASRTCFREAEVISRKRLVGLQHAVRVREREIKKITDPGV